MVGPNCLSRLSKCFAMVIFVLQLTGSTFAFEGPKVPVIPSENCAFPANLGKQQALAHLEKVHAFCSENSKLIQTTEADATVDISDWTQHMVNLFFHKYTHLSANIKCDNSNLRHLPMDHIVTISNVTVTIVNNRHLSSITLSHDVSLQNTKIIILNNPILEGSFLDFHGGIIKDVQSPNSCSPSINGTAVKSFKDLVDCNAIYGDLIIDDTTVTGNYLLATLIKRFYLGAGCLRITSKSIESLDFLAELDVDTEFAPKCSGDKDLVSSIEVNLEPSWQNERTREKLQHISLNSRNMSTAQALGFYKNGRDKECSGDQFTKEKCPVYYGDLVIDDCTEAGSVKYQNLLKIHGHLQIKNCKGATLSFPRLQKIMGDLDVSDNSELVALDVPKLVYVNEIHPVHNYKLQVQLSQEVNLINAIQNPTNAEELGISAQLGAFGAVAGSISTIHHFATIIILAFFALY